MNTTQFRWSVVGCALAVGALLQGDLHAASNANLTPGDASVGAAMGLQGEPALAEGAGGFLTVWQDLRTSPFAGPPFATEGRGWDIYTRRLDATGNPIDATPIRVFSGFGDQTAPQVAWNGQNWLVAWLTPSEFWSYSSLVRAVRIAPDGAILDDPPIIVATNAGSRLQMTTAGTDPINGAEWLLVTDTLRGYRVAPDGTLANPGGTQLFLPQTIIFHEITWAQGEYLLVRYSTASTDPHWAHRFTEDLSPIGDAFVVPSNAVASSGSDYFFQWTINDVYWDDFVQGQRMSTGGIFGPVLTAAGTGGALPLWSPPGDGVAWDGSNWWMAWLEMTRGAVFARVAPDDTVLDFGGLPVDATAVPNSVRAFDLVGRSAGGAGFAWQDGRNGTSTLDIYAAVVASDATPLPASSVSTAAPSQLWADFATGNTESLAVYASEQSGDRRILAQRFGNDCTPIDLEPTVIAAGAAISSPSVGFDGTRYLVVWADQGLTYGRRIAPDGTVIDASPLSIMDGASPDVAGMNGTFLVVATQPTFSIQFVHPFSMRLDGASGTPLDAAPAILGQYYARYPRVISFGGRWLATWQRNFTHDDVNSNVQAAFIEADGTPSAEFTVGIYGGTPDVAAAGDRVLFAWRTNSDGNVHNDVLGRTMLTDGTFATSAFAVSAGPTREFEPAVTFDGTDFVVAWTDMRNSIIYYDFRTEVYAARVTTGGTVVDPAGFALGDTALPERYPAATTCGGKTLIGWSSFRDEPALQSFRFAFQSLDGPSAANRYPVAVASVDAARGDAPFAVNFSAAGSADSDGTISTFAWDFGDGTTGSGANASHTYAVPGNYLAELTVTDNAGAATRNVVRVVATPPNLTPVAVAHATPTTGEAPLSVVFYANDAYDLDDGIQNWEWVFSDGGTYWGSTAYHTFTTPGLHTATLRAHDFRGAVGETTITIDVFQPVCGDGVAEGSEVCDGADVRGETCITQGCTGGTLICDATCSGFDLSGCTGCPICDNDFICEAGEDCNNCPNDCFAAAGVAICGNGICEAGNGEDCVACPSDCNGQTGGKPSRRFCCGDGDGVNPLPCSDTLCSSRGWSCTDVPVPDTCCGDGICEGSEDTAFCAIDCACFTDADCDDGIGCTLDSCVGGICRNIANDAACPDNGLFCDGLEFCDAAVGCQSYGNPCAATESCDESTDTCIACTPARGSCTTNAECCSGTCRNNGRCR